MVRLDQEGFINVDEVRYDNSTFQFQVMALTLYNEPVFKTVRVEIEYQTDDETYEWGGIVGTAGLLFILGCLGFCASRYMANVGEARKNNMMRSMRVSQDDSMDSMSRVSPQLR